MIVLCVILLFLSNKIINENRKLIQDLELEIENRTEKVEEMSTEIANLETIIENKNEKIKESKKVIEEKEKEIDEMFNRLGRLEKNIKTGELSSRGTNNNQKIIVSATAYVSNCKGCIGITKSGYDVRNTIEYDGMGIIATDESVIPLYSIVKIEGFDKKFIALDTGGLIKGNKIDILVDSKSTAINFGRKSLNVEILRNGK